MELPGRRELREQILHQMDGRTSYVSDADVYREIDKAILRSGHSGYGTLLSDGAWPPGCCAVFS